MPWAVWRSEVGLFRHPGLRTCELEIVFPPTVVFLVIYAVLLLLTMWSYAKVGVDANKAPAARHVLIAACFAGGVHVPGRCSQGTSPYPTGVAPWYQFMEQFAHKTERPGYDHQPQDDRQSHTSTDVRGVPYEQTSVLHVNIPDPTYHHTTTLQKNVALQKHEFQSSWSSRASERSPSKRTSVGIAHESHSPRDTSHNRQSSQTSTSHPTGSIHAIRSSEEARAREASTNPDMTRVVGNSLVPTTVSGQAPLRNKEYISDHHGENGSARNPNSREPARCPPATPILLPEFRYCSRCKIVKPHRTHHCRSCGTVSDSNYLSFVVPS